jgi:hypothetical protein
MAWISARFGLAEKVRAGDAHPHAPHQPFIAARIDERRYRSGKISGMQAWLLVGKHSGGQCDLGRIDC